MTVPCRFCDAPMSLPYRHLLACPVCRNVLGSVHYCGGPLQRIARPAEHVPACDCPPGWKHDPECPVVTGEEQP